LTSVEQLLVEHVRSGERLDLIPNVPEDETVDDAAMQSWDDSHDCSAAVIRDILRGMPGPHADPRGLRLRGAKIIGRLGLDNLTTDVNLELVDCLLEKGVRARDARLASVVLAGCQIEHATEPPLDGTRLTCTVLTLDRARVSGHTRSGAVNLPGAHIGGEFSCTGTDLRNARGPALVADGLQVDQDMFLTDFTATGRSFGGAVRLVGAHIGGGLQCDQAQLRCDSGPALAADGMQADRGMFLVDSTATCRALSGGAVTLRGAHIGANLQCLRAQLRNESGPALAADRMQADRDVFLGDTFTAAGRNEAGAVRLAGAHICDDLEMNQWRLRNDSGPALVADGMQVDGGVFLHAGGIAVGSSEAGAVRLADAHIAGDLDCTDAVLLNGDGPALAAEGLQVGKDVRLDGRFAAKAWGGGVAVDLRGARVSRMLVLDPAVLYAADPHQRLAVDGLTYSTVPEPVTGGDWLQLLHDRTRYAAQPYQQMATVYRALGDERKVRQVLIAQRDNQLAGTHARWPERVWGWITKITLGYGYKPWRALWFLAGVVLVSCLLAWVLGAHGALAQTDKTAAPGRPCTVVQQVSVGLDLNLPVGTSVARAKCDLTEHSASVTAAWLTSAGWVLRVLAWVFAALFIAGFTGAVRKT
jgi:hypothetical protein